MALPPFFVISSTVAFPPASLISTTTIRAVSPRSRSAPRAQGWLRNVGPTSIARRGERASSAEAAATPGDQDHLVDCVYGCCHGQDWRERKSKLEGESQPSASRVGKRGVGGRSGRQTGPVRLGKLIKTLGFTVNRDHFSSLTNSRFERIGSPQTPASQTRTLARPPSFASPSMMAATTSFRAASSAGGLVGLM